MISLRKVNAIFKMKSKMILKNNSILFGPLMAVGFVLLYKNIFPEGEGDEALHMKVFLLQIGVLFNILMSGLMATSMPLAEEKEKNTLRVLMTSSVNGAEFFIASLLPVLIMVVVVNIIILPISGNMDINIPLYILFTTIISCITMILGMIVGLVSKNQMATSLTSTPLLMVLMLFPLFSTMSEFMASVAKYIYTGTLNEVLNSLVFKVDNPITLQNILVVLGWIIISIIAFLAFYKRNGLDQE